MKTITDQEAKAINNVEKMTDHVRSLEISKDPLLRKQIPDYKLKLQAVTDSLLEIRHARVEIKGEQVYSLNNYINEGCFIFFCIFKMQMQYNINNFSYIHQKVYTFVELQTSAAVPC